MKSALSIILAILGLLLLGERVGLVGFHYPVWEENETLRDPVGVTKVEGNLVTLESGFVLEIEDEFPHEALGDLIAVGKKIDIEDAEGEALIYANTRQVRCGTPWARLIRIPLIPDKVASNRRRLIASGNFVEPESQANPVESNVLPD